MIWRGQWPQWPYRRESKGTELHPWPAGGTTYSVSTKTA